MISLVVDDSTVPNEGMRSWKEWFGIIHQRIVNFNLFKEAYNDDHGRRNEILTTRIYVLLMIIAVIIIVFYALITEHTVTYYVRWNFFKEKSNLLMMYLDQTTIVAKLSTIGQ